MRQLKFRRGVRIPPRKLRLENEMKMKTKLLEKAEVRIQAQLAELRSYLEEDPNATERIADGGHILEGWLRWRINHAARAKEEALGREAMKTKQPESAAKPTQEN
jgi:hypothetical protein